MQNLLGDKKEQLGSLSRQLKHLSIDTGHQGVDCDLTPVTTSPADMEVNQKRRQLCLMLLLAPLAACHSSDIVQPNEQSYKVIDFNWIDPARSRPVPARLYWPMKTAYKKTVPLVVFSHGMGGGRQGYSYLGKHWSTHGVASLHVQHVGSDAELWKGNPFGLIDRLQGAAQEDEALARTTDVSFALDQLLSAETGHYSAAIDHQRIVIAGHSYGANTALLKVGAQVVREGKTIDCLDSRFRAGIIISAPPFYGESDLKAVLSKISVPTIHITSTDDEINIPGYYSDTEDRLKLFNAISDPNKLLVVYRDGSHSMFTDRPFTGGLSLNSKVKTATADLTLAYFDLIFKGDDRALALWRTNWSSILEQQELPVVSPQTTTTS